MASTIEVPEVLFKCIKQFVTSVEKIVKFLLGQLREDPFSVVTVLIETRVLIKEALTEDLIVDPVALIDRCLKRSVLIVETVVRFLFNQQEINQYFVVTVLERKRELETGIIINLKLTNS